MCKVSVERACRLGNFSRGGWYRKSTARDQSGLRMRIRDIAMSRPRFGYQRIHVLLRREGWHVNLKRVHRLYCLEGLQVRMRVRRKKRMSLHRGPAPAPTGPGQRWSMDFVHDQLVNGQPFRVLTVVDNWSRESPELEVGFRLTGSSVVEALSPALLNTHPAYLPEFPGAHAVRDAMAAGVPETGASVIVVDNGVDTGPVVAQRRVPVLPGDTEGRLHDRIKLVERELLVEVVLDIANGRIELERLG